MTGFDVLLRVAQDDMLRLRHTYTVCSAQPFTPEHVGQHFVDLLARLDIPYVARPFDIEALLAAVAAAAERIRPENRPPAHS